MLKAIILVLSLTAFGALPALAEVDPKTHKLCLEAKDYLGCVKAMKGETSSETVIRQVQQQGASITEGNSCPAQHIYSGGGYCQRVTCVKRGLFGRGHGENLGGKGISCKGGAELTWDNTHQPIRASFNKDCPNYEPEVGYQSTCTQALAQGYVRQLTLGYKRDENGLIEKVFKDSPAENAGLRSGDIIISINETPIKSHKSRQVKEGEKFTLAVKQGSKHVTVDIVAEYVKIPIEEFRK